MTYAIISIIVLIAIYFLIQYNIFIKLNNNVKEAFATMDVYLKKRWDLIPNLVEVVKGYAKHEYKTLEKVVELRSTAYDKLTISDKINKNEELTTSINDIFAIAEKYPELKANQNYSELAMQLIKVEDEIANSRKYYNAVVKSLNTNIEIFPNNIIAKICRFKKASMFTTNENEKNNIKIEGN